MLNKAYNYIIEQGMNRYNLPKKELKQYQNPENK
jgi:hypothetical protein